MSSNARLEVLVVDDDRDVRLGLRGMLEDGGHAVEEALALPGEEIDLVQHDLDVLPLLLEKIPALLKLFEEGIELLRSASAQLDNAETKVQMLIERSEGGFELKEMDL